MNRILYNLQVASFSLSKIKQMPFTSAMTIAVIAMAFALPLVLFVLLQNVYQIGQKWEHGAQLSLFLKRETPESRIQEILQQIKAQSTVASATYISPTQGLEQLEQQGGFGDGIEHLPENPLPPVIEVHPVKMGQNLAQVLEDLLQEFKKIPEVETSKLDMEWLMRLASMVELAQTVIMGLVALCALGILLIVSNTIRLDTQNRRQEIEVCKLMGATNAFVRRPFLYTGIFYGVFGAIAAWLIVAIFIALLQSPVSQLASLYQTTFTLFGLGVEKGFLLLIVGAGLGFAGAWVTVERQIALFEP